MAIRKPKNSNLLDDLVLNFDPFAISELDQLGTSTNELSQLSNGAGTLGPDATDAPSGNEFSGHPTGLGPDGGSVGAFASPNGVTLPTAPPPGLPGAEPPLGPAGGDTPHGGPLLPPAAGLFAARASAAEDERLPPVADPDFGPLSPPEPSGSPESPPPVADPDFDDVAPPTAPAGPHPTVQEGAPPPSTGEVDPALGMPMLPPGSGPSGPETGEGGLPSGPFVPPDSGPSDPETGGGGLPVGPLVPPDSGDLFFI
jgi:hypothetical protein